MALTCKRLRATSQKATHSVDGGGGQEGERELIKQEITKNGRSVPASNILPMQQGLHLQEQKELKWILVIGFELLSKLKVIILSQTFILFVLVQWQSE